MSAAAAAVRSVMSTRRPWLQLLDPTSLSPPSSIPDATSRLTQNLAFFSFNYTTILLLIIFLGLLYHPISLIVFFIILAAWFFLYFSRDEPLTVLNHTFDDRFVFIVLSVATVVGLGLTGVWVNVILSLLIGGILVSLHAVLRSTEDIGQDEGETPYGALLSEVDI